MCGIFGAVTRHRLGADAIAAAHRAQAHRGPNGHSTHGEGIGDWWVTLGHQRLAVIDLSHDADQPMIDEALDSALIFNGEIYNYVELRETLAARTGFRTRSDTEVLQKALGLEGTPAALESLNGMWAFALLDRRRRKLVISRDRGAEKPLYLARSEEGLFFASEIKTLLALVGRRVGIDPQVAGEYLVQALGDASERTFFEGVTKLPAGSFAEIDLDAPELVVDPVSYWTCPVEAPATSRAALAERVRETFIDAVRIRLRSDVPVGVLLSGGIDSSAIAAAVKTLGANEALTLLSAVDGAGGTDESVFIDRMASHLGREVTKVPLALRAENAVDLLREATWHNDEPVGSFSAVAHHLLMKRAREAGITVVLSGQGADEILCGYKKYLGFRVQELMRDGHPLAAARLLGGFALNGSILGQFSLAEARRYLPGRAKAGSGDIRGEALRAGFTPRPLGLGKGTLQERQRADLLHYSVPALCHYEDRMSMATGREIRLPFLDPRLVEMLVPAPAEHKLGGGWTKRVFREAMADLLPKEIAWRKDKQGFLLPQADWLKDALRPVLLEHFSPDSRMVRAGLVDHAALAARYEEFCRQPAGQGRIWFREIFAPFALEVWMRRFEDHLAC